MKKLISKYEKILRIVGMVVLATITVTVLAVPDIPPEVQQHVAGAAIAGVLLLVKGPNPGGPNALMALFAGELTGEVF